MRSCCCACRRSPPGGPASGPWSCETYAALLNAGITPVVREYGSLGCSGDLAPLAHCALALMGEGEVRDSDHRLMPAAEALARGRHHPGPAGREGGPGADQRHRRHARHAAAGRCTTCGCCCGRPTSTAAMSVEGLLGTDAVFAADLQALRPQTGPGAERGQPARAAGRFADRGQPPGARGHPGAGRVLAALLAAGARRRPRHPRARRGRGGARAALGRRQPGRHRWTAGSSPTATSTARPVAYVLDFLAIVVADLASISERRTDRFLDRARSARAAAVPGRRPGRRQRAHDRAVHPGRDRLRAQAARRPRLGRLDPVSSAMQEDHVSMGWAAARKLRRAVDGLARVLAIELLTAARALDLRAPLTPARATGAVVAGLRERVAGPGPGPVPVTRDRGHSGLRRLGRRRRGRRGGGRATGLTPPVTTRSANP